MDLRAARPILQFDGRPGGASLPPRNGDSLGRRLWFFAGKEIELRAILLT